MPLIETQKHFFPTHSTPQKLQKSSSLSPICSCLIEYPNESRCSDIVHYMMRQRAIEESEFRNRKGTLTRAWVRKLYIAAAAAAKRARRGKHVLITSEKTTAAAAATTWFIDRPYIYIYTHYTAR